MHKTASSPHISRLSFRFLWLWLYSLTSYVQGHVKKIKSKFYAFGWFRGLQNLEVIFGKFTVQQVLKSFAEIIP